MVVGIGLVVLTAFFSLAYAGGTISIKDAFLEGKIKLVFEGGGGNGNTLKIHVENIGNTPMKISVPKGETTFELNSQAIKTISFNLTTERTNARCVTSKK